MNINQAGSNATLLQEKKSSLGFSAQVAASTADGGVAISSSNIASSHGFVLNSSGKHHVEKPPMIPHSSASSQRQSMMDQFAASNGTTSGGRFRN